MGYEYIGHNAATAVNGTSQSGGVAQVFVEFDAVFREELSMFIAGQPIHFVFRVFPAFVGTLDATSGWSIVAGNSQANGGTVTEINRLLYQAFAKRTASNDSSPVVVLNSPCKDLTGRSRTFIYQYNERCLLAATRTVGILFHARIFTSLCIYNEFPFRKELVYHTGGGFHVTAGITTQVDDETFTFLMA